MQKLVIFAGHCSGICELLVRNTIITLASREDVEVVAVCIPAKQEHKRNLCVYYLRTILTLLHQSTNQASTRALGFTKPVSLRKMSRCYGFEIHVPPQGDINCPEFVNLLQDRFKPTTALSLYCLQKFSKSLIDIFDDTVNYHNGKLPQYRGLMATAWSVYNNENETGFAFHRMTGEIDSGPILIQHAFSYDSSSNTSRIELKKALASRQFINPLFDKLLRRDPGRDQSGSTRYYSRSDLENITRIEDPMLYTAEELMRRLRAFLALDITIQGRVFRVTRVRQLKTGKFAIAPTFQCSEGKYFLVERVEYQPYFLFLLLKTVYGTYSALKRIGENRAT